MKSGPPRAVPSRWVVVTILTLAAAAVDGPCGAQPGKVPLRILSITPGGEDVPPARQIVLQFDRPVVPVGRMERDADELPITIDPPLECEWRWLNTSALACRIGRHAG